MGNELWAFGSGKTGLGLLLGDTMDGAAFKHKVARLDADDLAAGKALPEKSERPPITFRLAENRSQHRAVQDQEIRIARRQPIEPPSAPRHEGLWHLHRQHLHPVAGGGAQTGEAFPVL